MKILMYHERKAREPEEGEGTVYGPPKTQRLLEPGDLYSYMGRQKGNQSIEAQSDDEDNVSQNLLLGSIFSSVGFSPFRRGKGGVGERAGVQ